MGYRCLRQQESSVSLMLIALYIVSIISEFHGSDEGSSSSNELKPGGLDSVSRTFIPPPSPGMLSTNSQWSDLIRLGQTASRNSSFSGMSMSDR